MRAENAKKPIWLGLPLRHLTEVPPDRHPNLFSRSL